MKLYVDESDTIRGRVIELMVDNVDYSGYDRAEQYEKRISRRHISESGRFFRDIYFQIIVDKG